MADHLDKLYSDYFLTPLGQDILADLKDAFYDRPMFQPGEDTSGLTLAFREGQRSVVLDILSAIKRGQDITEELPTRAIDEDNPDV